MYFLKLFTVSAFLIINSNNVFSAGSSSDTNNRVIEIIILSLFK